MESSNNIYQTERETVVSRSCNMAGSGPKSLNQDSYQFLTHTHEGKNYMIAVMCDGHGTNGEWFAIKTAEELSRIILTDLDKILENPTERLEIIFTEFNQYLKAEGTNYQGGTTATVWIKTKGREIVANVGDCDVYTRLHRKTYIGEINADGGKISCRRDGCEIVCGDDDDDDELTEVFKLSQDHSGESDKEVLRILEHNNHRFSFIYGMSSVFSRMVNVCEPDEFGLLPKDENRIKRRPYQNIPGIYANNVDGTIATYFYDKSSNKKLNMGRSLGDFTMGFISDCPSVCELIYPEDMGSTTIIGSDGYFNCITKQQKKTELTLSAQQVCDNSVVYVENTFGCKNADNMTVLSITIV